MLKRNIAVALLSAMGAAIFRNNAPLPINPLADGQVDPKPQRRRTSRWGRNSQVRDTYKHRFNDKVEQTGKPKHTKLARKAALGEVGLMGRARGMQVRSVGGVLRITR